MTRSLRIFALTLSLAAASISPALADEVMLKGAVDHPLALTADLLKSLPPIHLDIAFQTAKGKETGSYTGAALWPLVEKAGITPGPGKNSTFRHTLIVTGSDGYAVAIAIGEIEPNLEGKSVILAYEGGMPPATPEHLRLVVPGDAHGGRSVRDVASIELR